MPDRDMQLRSSRSCFAEMRSPEASSPPDEATAINALMADKNARYQITGPKAFNRYGYSEQIPALTTIYNDAISGERRVGSVSLKLIKVARDRLGGVEKVRMPSGETLVYSSRARTLVDAMRSRIAPMRRIVPMFPYCTATRARPPGLASSEQ